MILGQDRPMQGGRTPTTGPDHHQLRHGSPNAATVMDLLSAVQPKGVLFLGKCGGLKDSTEIGHFILPIAAIRGEGTSDDYFPPVRCPRCPVVQAAQVRLRQDPRTRDRLPHRRRLHHQPARLGARRGFKATLREMTCMAIDMETATLFIVGHVNEIARGALLLVSDVPMTPEGVKTEQSDKVTAQWVKLHLQIGIEAMTEIGQQGEQIKHFRYEPG
jgi:AMP nucleosidase